jgi:hypothetical protein
MAFKASRSDTFKKMYKYLTKKDNPLKLRLKKKMAQILECPENHDMKTGDLKGIVILLTFYTKNLSTQDFEYPSFL